MREPSRHSLTRIFVLGLGVLAVLLVAAIWGGLIGVSREAAQLDRVAAAPSWAHVAPAQIAAARENGVPVAFENDLGMRFVLIPAGTFRMGSPEDEEGRRDVEGPQHEVRLTRAFYLQETAVTNAQYRRKVKGHESDADEEEGGEGSSADSQLVGNVSWHDAAAFATWLSERDPSHDYRLPMEAEWEYACRAGTQTPFWWGMDVSGAPRDATAADESEDVSEWEPTRGHAPHPWGLRGMPGGTHEWCSDGYGSYPEGPAVDPSGPSSGATRSVRGACWEDGWRFLRSADRSGLGPGGCFPDLGFRLVSPLPEAHAAHDD